MHTKPMSESEGTFDKDWQATTLPCRGCGKEGHVYVRTWESDCGGYEDDKYQCRACGKVWWIDGPDA
jgi:RecJ-like exonuclease